MKEITHLQNQLGIAVGKHTHLQGYKYIEVQFFDATDLISQDMRDILNRKIETIRDRYEMSLVSLEDQNKKHQVQIGQFRKLGEMGNIGIAFDEMNVESIIQKL